MKSPLTLAVITSLVIALALAVPMARPGFGGGSAQATHQAEGGTIALLAIDMDITGNTIDPPVNDAEQVSLGSIEDCRQISIGETTTIDIVVQGYPSDHPLVGYGISLIYDPTIVKIVGGLDTFDGSGGNILPELRTLISSDPQSGPLIPFTDSLPDDSYFFVNVGDLSPRQAGFDPGGLDESVDGEETIDGFLTRITLEAVGAGTSSLTIGPGTALEVPSIQADFDLGGEIPIDNLNADLFTSAIEDPPSEAQSRPDGILDSIQGTAISVDEPCVAPAATPPTEAVSPWATLPVTQPPESEAATATAIAAQADSEGTPSGTTPAGPPTSGGAPGDGDTASGGESGQEQADSDGGLGVAGWVAIGVGLSAALAALGTATWYMKRQRRQQP